MKPRVKPSEREARAHEVARNARFILQSLSASERRHMAMVRDKVEREKLYGETGMFGDFLTPEMERRVRDSIRVVNLVHTGAGRNKQTEALAIKVTDEVGMLHSRGVITGEQKLAAEKLYRDFFGAGLQGVNAFDYAQEKVDHAVVTQSHDEEIVERLDAVDRYIRAIRVVPISCWPVVRDVVLQEKRLDVVRMRGMSSKKLRRVKIITLLQIGLEQLSHYYGFKRRKYRQHAKMSADARPNRADFGSSATVENISEHG